MCTDKYSRIREPSYDVRIVLGPTGQAAILALFGGMLEWAKYQQCLPAFPDWELATGRRLDALRAFFLAPLATVLKTVSAMTSVAEQVAYAVASCPWAVTIVSMTVHHGACFALSATVQCQDRNFEVFSANVLLTVPLVYCIIKDLRRKDDSRKFSRTSWLQQHIWSS